MRNVLEQLILLQICYIIINLGFAAFGLYMKHGKRGYGFAFRKLC